MNDMKEKAMGAVKAFLERKGYEIVDEAWQGPEGIGGIDLVAVDEDGNFYILTAPLTLSQRLRGVKPEPAPPTLILGKGGRDGEQIDLTEALSMRIPTWAEG